MSSSNVGRIIPPEELVDDNTVLLSFVIEGRPATKKTHQSAFTTKTGRTVVLPSKQYKKYEKVCQKTCESVWKDKGNIPMDFGISISVKIYLDDWCVGDHCGYLQALGDIFEKYDIIDDDKFIHWTDDGSHWFNGIDKENPRVEVVIRRFRHPYEEYRASKMPKNKRPKKDVVENS